MKNYKVSALMMCIMLTGCSGGKVLFNKEDPRSGFTKTKDITFEFVPDLNSECSIEVVKKVPVKTPGTSPESVTGVDVALAIGSFGYSLAKSEVNNLIASKIKEYSAEYTKLVSYYPQDDVTAMDSQEMCFSFQRNVSAPDDSNPKNGLSFTIGYRKFGNSDAFVVVLSNIKLSHSGALTTSNEGVNLVISTTMTTIPKEPFASGVINTSNFSIQNVPFSNDDDKGDNKKYYGPIFTKIPYKTPIYLSVSVTEKGNGVDNLTTLQDDIKNNSDAAKALLDIAIKKHYEE